MEFHKKIEKPFSLRLRELMDSTGTTQTVLAEAIGMTRQAVSLYAKGKSTPNIGTLMKIADFFGVSYDYLLNCPETYEEHKRPEPPKNRLIKENGAETTREEYGKIQLCIDRLKHLVIGFIAGFVTGFSLMGILVTLFMRR